MAALATTSFDPPVLAGYLPSWAMSSYQLGRLDPLTDVLYFSIQPNADGTLNLADIDLAHLPKLRNAKQRYGFRLLISCGGWERSAGFYPMSSNAANRKRFVNQAFAFCEREGFDGIDLDWEHPSNADQANAYGDLIRDLRVKFAPSGRIVTAAIAAWQTMSAKAVQNLDRVHLMSYDHQGKHATMEDARKDIDLLRTMGFPNRKIVLGVPFYGRSLTNWNQTITYRDLVAQFDPPAKADEVGGYYFNGRDTLREKADLSLRRNLGGIMIWEVTQDVTGPKSLLKVLSETLHQP